MFMPDPGSEFLYIYYLLKILFFSVLCSTVRVPVLHFAIFYFSNYFSDKEDSQDQFGGHHCEGGAGRCPEQQSSTAFRATTAP